MHEVTWPMEGTPLRRMNSRYWPEGATVASGGAVQVVEVPAAVHASTSCRASMWLPCVTAASLDRTTLQAICDQGKPQCTCGLRPDPSAALKFAFVSAASTSAPLPACSAALQHCVLRPADAWDWRSRSGQNPHHPGALVKREASGSPPALHAVVTLSRTSEQQLSQHRIPSSALLCRPALNSPQRQSNLLVLSTPYACQLLKPGKRQHASAGQSGGHAWPYGIPRRRPGGCQYITQLIMPNG